MEDLLDFKPFLVDAINSAIPNLFEEVKGFKKDAKLEMEDVQFHDSLVENQKAGVVGKGAIFVSLIASTLMITVVVSTFLIWRSKR